MLHGGEMAIEGESDNDIADFKHATSPEQPSAEKVEKHRVNGHLPYRSWCKQCILGCGGRISHTTTGSESLVLIIN